MCPILHVLGLRFSAVELLYSGYQLEVEDFTWEGLQILQQGRWRATVKPYRPDDLWGYLHPESKAPKGQQTKDEHWHGIENTHDESGQEGPACPTPHPGHQNPWCQRI